MKGNRKTAKGVAHRTAFKLENKKPADTARCGLLKNNLFERISQ